MAMIENDSIQEEPVHLPIEDTIDLHTFQPKEAASVLEEYFFQCVSLNILEVRVIHGKGTGILREKVHAFLKKCPLVVSYSLAGETGGAWGATMVRLKPPRSTRDHL